MGAMPWPQLRFTFWDIGFLRGGRIIRVKGTDLDVVHQPLIRAVLEPEKEVASGGSRKTRACNPLLNPVPARPCCTEVGGLLEVSARRKEHF